MAMNDQQVIRVILPWPSKTLSPNARPHHMVLHKAKKAARAGAKMVMQDALRSHGLKCWPEPAEGGEWPRRSIPVTITFLPPDNRGRDDDNMIAALKASRDGLAEAMGVDDKAFAPDYQVGPVMKGGAVAVDFVLANRLAEICPRKAAQRESGAGMTLGSQIAPTWLRGL